MRFIAISFAIISVTFAHPDTYDIKQYGLGSAASRYQTFVTSEDNSESVSAQQASDEQPLISKQFYIHSAPEDNDANKQPKQFTLGRSQKNYRVVFIKAPAASSLNNQLLAQYAPQEEKTHIYVLSQKEHEININDIATPAPTQPSKPEVFFIKYKTQQEAELAQKEIQAQYDSLGGESKVSDEGIAPHTSFIGALSSESSAAKSKSLSLKI